MPDPRPDRPTDELVAQRVHDSLHALMTAGIAGRPLYGISAGGAFAAHVIVKVRHPATRDGDDIPVLVPIALRGGDEIRKFAVMDDPKAPDGLNSFWRSEDGLVYSDVSPFCADPIPLSRFFAPQDHLALFAAHLLGVDPRDGVDPDGREHPLAYFNEHNAVGVEICRYHQIDPGTIRLPRELNIDIDRIEDLREEAEDLLRRCFAVVEGRIAFVSAEPRWTVSMTGEGVVSVRADLPDNDLVGPAAVAMNFRGDRLDEALVVAEQLANLRQDGALQVKENLRVVNAKLFHDDDEHAPTILAQARVFATLFARFAAHFSTAALARYARLLNYAAQVGAEGNPRVRRPFALDEWRPVWSALSRALGDTSPRKPSDDEPSDDDLRMAMRLHETRTVLDLLSNPLPVSRRERQEPRNHAELADASLPFSLEEASLAVTALKSLLPSAGAGFGKLWIETRNSIEDYRFHPDLESASLMISMLAKLGDAAPSAFPSPAAAGRWAMTDRPRLLQLARLGEEFEADVGDAMGRPTQ